MNRKIVVSSFLLAFLFASSCVVSAQQSIINVPSSEMLPQGSMIFKESNFINPNDSFRITPSVIFGVGKGFELSSGVAATLDSSHSVRADIGVKKVFFLPHNLRLTTGARVSPYLNQNAEPDSFVYSHLSHRIKKTRTTLTAGVYASSRQECLPSNTGALVGIEQVIIPNKLRIVADYMSRDDRYGSFAAGFKYRPIPTLSVTSAIVVMPEDDDRVAFNLSVSKFFSLKSISNKIKEGL